VNWCSKRITKFPWNCAQCKLRYCYFSSHLCHARPKWRLNISSQQTIAGMAWQAARAELEELWASINSKRYSHTVHWPMPGPWTTCSWSSKNVICLSVAPQRRIRSTGNCHSTMRSFCVTADSIGNCFARRRSTSSRTCHMHAIPTNIMHSVIIISSISDEVLVWLSVPSEVQTVCIWSSWCHCHPTTWSSLTSFKSRLVLPVWYQLTQVVLEQRPLNGCCSCISSSIQRLITDYN